MTALFPADPAVLFGSLVNIVVLDLVLSGDNAVVIAMAVQHLPAGSRQRAAVVGALGAIVLRFCFAALASVLLAVPYLQAVGGAVLFWIAFQLLVGKEEDTGARQEVHSFREAVRVIVMADLVMSLDNILAVGGASHGHLGLLAFGLVVSIPLVLFGSALLTNLLRRWPALGYVGAGVLAWTAGRMIVHDPFVHGVLTPYPMLDAVLPSLGVFAVVAAGYRATLKQREGRRPRGAGGDQPK